MSEKERKRRLLYRKNREKWIFAQAMVAIVLAIAIIISSIVAYNLNKTKYIGYRDGGDIDYNVLYKDNEFFESNYLDQGQSYVASLIDKVFADFSYEIEMDTDDVNYKYSYTITSRLEIMDDTSKKAIYNPEYEMVNVENKIQSSKNRLRINEIVIIDYDQYNDLANRFLATYDLTSTTSNIVVTLEVDVLSDFNSLSGSGVDNYKSELRIPLTTKTVDVKMTAAIPDNETKMIACTRGAGYEVFKTTAIVLGVFEVLVVLLMAAFIYLTRTEDITYISRVKKIVSQYKSYIQKIKNAFDPAGYQRIFVDTFDEMLEIRDTIQAPVLMYENPEKTCTKFMIPTDSKLLYVYEVKIEGYTEPDPDPTPAPSQTVVSPNITNVVRPVVKVVLNPNATSEKAPDPVYDTVLEEPEVMADESVDVVACTMENDEDDVYPEAELVIDADEAAAEEDAAIEEIAEAEKVEAVEASDFTEEVVAASAIPEDVVIDCAPEALEVVETVEAAESVEATPAPELDGESEDEAASVSEEDNDEDGDLTTVIDGRVVQFRYRKSFQAKLIQADDKIKSFYVAIKNKLLSYKGVKARTSWSFESCNRGRIQCAKLNIKGKTMLVYLNLNTENYNANKYHFRNVGDKAKFAEVPMLLKVKSDRGLKYVLELIDEMMNVLEIPLGKVQNVEYDIPYRSTQELIDEGLIKVVYPYESVLDEDFKPAADAAEADSEIESLLASIPSADDGEVKATVDAIDVRLGNDAQSTERYDPDGNEVAEGDVVLVPARVEGSDRDVVCVAEVARGNYKVDREALDSPLKKIIGVVRRKAEQIFTAMITPVDENKD